MKYDYALKTAQLLETVEKKNEKALEILISEMIRTVKEDRIIHTFGTGHGHMIGMEMFTRAGGLGNVNCIMDYDTLLFQGAERSGAIERLCGVSDIIFDTYDIQPGDIMIISSNSGRNAMPLEMAMRCRKEGIFTAAITSAEVSKTMASRHPSGRKLYECADLVLDNCCPEGDCVLEYGGVKTGPASSMAGFLLVNIAASETVRRCLEMGIVPPVYQSQNIDVYDNSRLTEKYRHRIRHI
ncbi:MAG: SIS domain-containing protein [Solobacterium sp.]|nr:SIS domain-containing protein [Erysipelotrichaceae bacterium]MBQ9152217.1 SIS domain-containing protein [Solobacterium sp.]